MNADKDKYPVLELLDELNLILESQNTVILQAPPGAGKSTILPLELIKNSWMLGRKIIMLQPRRIATRSVAMRMAALLQEEIGKSIGYRVKFEKIVSKETRIEVVTEGILTQMLQTDPSLEGVGIIIFDEFHERSIHADLAFTLSREVQKYLRPELKILIMSATISKDLTQQLSNVPVLRSSGRQFPVTIEYNEQESDDPVTLKVLKAVQRLAPTSNGDILIFLPGAGEILKVKELIDALELENIITKPLYGDLPFIKQQEALLPMVVGKRKIVLATSIAETSLTIEGICVVVDSGFSKTLRYNSKTGLSKLQTEKVSKDAADQRAGRAGRLGPGKCLRLWTERTHHQLEVQRKPEILESDLASLVLELLRWGTKDFYKLNWITPPPAPALQNAYELLETLGAIQGGKITDKGRALCLLHVHPRIGHLLLEGKQTEKLPLAIDIASILEERDPIIKNSGADIGIRVEALRNFRKGTFFDGSRDILLRIEKNAAYWRKSFRVAVDNGKFNDKDAGRLIFAAYPERLAMQKENDPERYRLGNGKIVKIETGDILLYEKCIAVAHMDEGRKEGKIFLAAPVDIEKLEQYTHKQKRVEWDKEKGLLISLIDKKIGQLTIHSSSNDDVTTDEKVKVLIGAVKMEGHLLFNWDKYAISLIDRVESVRIWHPQEGLPSVSINSLLKSIENWLPSYIDDIRKREDFYKINMSEVIKNQLSWDQQKIVDELAPATLKVPTGSDIEIKYLSDGSSPILAVRLQELFGLMETPAINNRFTKVIIHLLSPGYKPVQVTQDLKSFWTNAYQSVRKELRSKYPKHYWPEDPLKAEPTRGVKKKLGR